MRSTRRLSLCAAVLILGAACAENKELQVRLETHQPPQNDVHQLEIQAQVMGPQAGLRYKWFSVLGQLDPQESSAPKTSYTFASNSSRDRVWLEVWRDNDRLAQSEIDVVLDASVPVVTQRAPAIQIEITGIPRYQPEGGPDTRADISGSVGGEIPPGVKVVIYARADAWYIQPLPYTMHQIQPDGTWKSWTHTGSSYAALVVRPDFKPFTRLDVLPQVEGEVIARTIAEGKRE
jgi:hypothetical protein